MYLSQTNDLNKLHYIFDVNKFSNKEKILEQFKKMYINNVDRIFKGINEGGLGVNKIQQLFGKDIRTKKQFIDKLNNNNLFDFISLTPWK